MERTLNNLAARCERAAIASGQITAASSPRVSMFDISRRWRELCEAGKRPGADPGTFSQREQKAAEVILASMAYLHRIGCTDIEKLLRQTLRNQFPVRRG